MKRLVFIILIFFLFSAVLGACSDGTEGDEPSPSVSPAATVSGTPDPTDTPEFKDTGIPDSIHLVECMFYGSSEENSDYQDAWPRLVSEHYGVDLTMTIPDRQNYMETVQTAASSGELTGIVELFGGPYLAKWKSEDFIYPLSDFLRNNEVWNTMIPDYWKEAYTIDGEVWAIPSGSDGTRIWFARTIRGDWLDKFNLEKPYDIDEFYEASYKFTYEDPDGDGRDNTVGFTSMGIQNLQDIFQAFDARLNYIGEAKPVWNPNTGLWEDSLQKPEMIDCLEFLKDCYDKNILDPECFSGLTGAELREKISSGLYGGTYYWDTWTLTFESENKKADENAYFECLGALAGVIDKNLNHYSEAGIGSPRVMMKSTPQPLETINWYVNTFFGDDWGFWTARLGPVGEYRGQEGRVCTIEGNTIVRNTYVDDTGAVRTYPGPGYIGGLPEKALYTVYEVAYHVPSPPVGYETWAEDTAAKAKNNVLRRRAWLDEYIENGMAYMLPNDLRELSGHAEITIASIHNEGEAAIKKAITGETSISDALAEYRDAAKTLGVQEKIDFANNKLSMGESSGN